MHYTNIFAFLVLVSSVAVPNGAFHVPTPPPPQATKRTYTANMKDMIRKMPFSCSAATGADGDDELFANAGSNMPPMPPIPPEDEEKTKEEDAEDAEDTAFDEEYAKKGFDEDTRKKLKKLAQTFRRKIKQTYRGYDLRPTDTPKDSAGNELTTDDFIFDYAESFRKKDLLNKLQDPKIPNVEKLRLLGEKRFLYDEF